MSAYGVRNGNARRHGAHDSALDVPSKDEVARLRMRELEEENSLLLEKATSSCTWEEYGHAPDLCRLSLTLTWMR